MKRRGLSQCDEDTPMMLTDLLKKALAIALSTSASKCVLSQQERTAFRSHQFLNKKTNVVFRTEAIDLLTELTTRHEDDSTILYNMSVLLAENAKYSTATRTIKAAMANCSGSFDPAWALYALILSAK